MKELLTSVCFNLAYKLINLHINESLVRTVEVCRRKWLLKQAHLKQQDVSAAICILTSAIFSTMRCNHYKSVTKWDSNHGSLDQLTDDLDHYATETHTCSFGSNIAASINEPGLVIYHSKFNLNKTTNN